MRFREESELEAFTIQDLLDSKRIEFLISNEFAYIDIDYHRKKLRGLDLTFSIKKGLQYPLEFMLFSHQDDVLVPNTPIAQINYVADPITDVTTRLTHAGARVVPLPGRYDLWNMMYHPTTFTPYFPQESNWEHPDQGCGLAHEIKMGGGRKGISIAKFIV